MLWGYECSDADGAIERLRERLALQRGFPHEIGMFLGYPVEDVKGFIKHNGRNSKCVGCWKVYCNQCEAERAFARFNKCREVYMRLWRQGKSGSAAYRSCLNNKFQRKDYIL